MKNHTDRGGTITTAGVSQIFCQPLTKSLVVTIANNSNNNLWVNELGAAAINGVDSYKLGPGMAMDWEGNDIPTKINITGEVDGQTFLGREW